MRYAKVTNNAPQHLTLRVSATKWSCNVSVPAVYNPMVVASKPQLAGRMPPAMCTPRRVTPSIT